MTWRSQLSGEYEPEIVKGGRGSFCLREMGRPRPNSKLLRLRFRQPALSLLPITGPARRSTFHPCSCLWSVNNGKGSRLCAKAAQIHVLAEDMGKRKRERRNSFGEMREESLLLLSSASVSRTRHAAAPLPLPRGQMEADAEENNDQSAETA